MLQIFALAFCGVGDHLPLHNLLLAAAARGHNVTVGVESMFKCGTNAWPVPAELSGRFRFVDFHFDSGQSLDSDLASSNPWFKLLLNVAEGRSRDTSVTAQIVEKALLPIFKPSARWLASALKESPFPERRVVVTHTLFSNAHDVALVLKVPFVGVWLSAMEMSSNVLDLLGLQCGGMSTAELSGSLWARLRAVGCFVRFLTAVDMGDLEAIRKSIIAEHGGDPDRQYIGMLALHSTMRQVTTNVPGFTSTQSSPLVTGVGPMVFSNDASVIIAGADDWHTRVVVPFLEEASRVIVLSFGSTAVPPSDFIDVLVDAAAELMARNSDIRFVIAASWRKADFQKSFARHCDDAAPDEAATVVLCKRRVVVAKWIKQRAVIAYPQVKVVGSHCGWGSLSETLMAGKAMLAYGFYFDQLDNAQRVAEWGAAIRVDRTTVTAKQVSAALTELLQNASYAQAALRFRTAAEFAGGVSRAVDVIENEAAIGHAHLIDRRVSFWDAIAIVLGGVLLALWLAVRGLRSLCCRGRAAERMKPKQN